MSLESVIASIKPINQDMLQQAQERLRNQAKPAGSLGVLESLGARLASIAGTLDVNLRQKKVVVCAGDHGVAAEGVSLFPQEVTEQMVYNFVNGGASINVLARHAGAEVSVVDCGVNADFPADLPIFHKKVAKGSANMAVGPAMTREQAVASIEAGIEVVAELSQQGRVDIIATGDMGIANTTASTAVIAAFSGKDPADLAGRGTGISDEGLAQKRAVLQRALEINNPDPRDPLDVLAKVGGFEIGGLAGVVIGAAAAGIPVVCDGLISTAGAVVACELAPAAREYLFASHKSVECAHSAMHAHLGLEPLFDFGLRLGEGTGAALALEILDAATRVLADIKTFAEIGITDCNQD
jgi:nicotinate-nucleotide--dimethylbenzimidazole phosphoribosyltransferase